MGAEEAPQVRGGASAQPRPAEGLATPPGSAPGARSSDPRSYPIVGPVTLPPPRGPGELFVNEKAESRLPRLQAGTALLAAVRTLAWGLPRALRPIPPGLPKQAQSPEGVSAQPAAGGTGSTAGPREACREKLAGPPELTNKGGCASPQARSYH